MNKICCYKKDRNFKENGAVESNPIHSYNQPSCRRDSVGGVGVGRQVLTP